MATWVPAKAENPCKIPRSKVVFDIWKIWSQRRGSGKQAKVPPLAKEFTKKFERSPASPLHKKELVYGRVDQRHFT